MCRHNQGAQAGDIPRGRLPTTPAGDSSRVRGRSFCPQARGLHPSMSNVPGREPSAHTTSLRRASRPVRAGRERADRVQIGYKGSEWTHTDERKPHDSAVHMGDQGALAVLCHHFGHSGPRSPPVRCQEVPPRPTRGSPTLEHRQESSTPAANLLDPLQPSFDTLHTSMLVQYSHNTDNCHSTTREQERQAGGTREQHNDPHHKTTPQTATRSIGVNDNPNSVIS